MVNMGDYIGKLLSEITTARVQADIEAIRMAEIYSSHPLLRNFPVPRIRLPNVELNVPVVISEVDGEEPEPAADRVDTRALVEITENSMKAELKKNNVVLNNTELSKLRRTLAARSEEMGLLRERPVSMLTISKNISSETAKILGTFNSVKRKMDNDALRLAAKKMEGKIRDELITRRRPPSRIRISPITSHVREMGDKEQVVTLKLFVTEDAVEWSSFEEDGETRDILIPE